MDQPVYLLIREGMGFRCGFPRGPLLVGAIGKDRFVPLGLVVEPLLQLFGGNNVSQGPALLGDRNRLPLRGVEDFAEAGLGLGGFINPANYADYPAA